MLPAKPPMATSATPQPGNAKATRIANGPESTWLNQIVRADPTRSAIRPASAPPRSPPMLARLKTMPMTPGPAWRTRTR